MILQQFIADAQFKLAIKYGEREANAILNNLLYHVFKYSKADLLFKGADEIEPEKENYLLDALTRLMNNEPLQYITGQAYFYDLVFEVNPAVLIPRPETEELADWIIHYQKKNAPKILDIGTGSGCIAVTLAKYIPDATVTAIDISVEACNIAKKNSLHNEVTVEVVPIDILKNKFQRKKFDIIVSNPPYIPEKEKTEMSKNVVDFEPSVALFVPDETPLLFYDKISEFALKHLRRKGNLFFEIHENYSAEVSRLLEEKGYKNIVVKKDLQGKDRMICCDK